MPREPFQLDLDLLIADTKDLLPIKEAMSRPLESVLRSFAASINQQFLADFYDEGDVVHEEDCTDPSCLCEEDPPPGA